MEARNTRNTRNPNCFWKKEKPDQNPGMIKLTRLIFEKPPTQEEEKRIFEYFLESLLETAALLVTLELEEHDALDKKLKSGDIEELFILTLVHIGYASRHCADGILLANQESLTRQACPQQARCSLFDEIMYFKKSINNALESTGIRDGKKREFEESYMIKLIKNGKTLPIKDRPDATAAQICLVNEMISRTECLKNSSRFTKRM